MKIISITMMQLLHRSMSSFINHEFEDFLKSLHMTLTPEKNRSFIPMAFIDLSEKNNLRITFCEEFYKGAYPEIINVLWGREDIELFYRSPKIIELYEKWKDYYETNYKI